MSDIVERLGKKANDATCWGDSYIGQRQQRWLLEFAAVMREGRDEIKRLRAALRSCPCPGGGFNGMPKDIEPTIGLCMEHRVCGCEFGRALEGK